MNDFLQSLRSGKDKRFDRTRRTYDGNTFRPHDRTPGNERRKKGPYKPQNADQAYAAISKILPSIQTVLETIAEDRKELIEVEARKAAAMERIATYLSSMLGQQPAAADPSSPSTAETPPSETIREADPPMIREQQEASPAESAETETETDPTTDRICHLRESGLSYEGIARQLEAEGIPTPSGRGRWRGQTVSKLFNQGADSA